MSIADDLATATATLGTDAEAAQARVTADLANLRSELADAQTALQAAIDAGQADAATLQSVLTSVQNADGIVNSIDPAPAP